ncbi:MAG: UPF0280 family protein [Spirochaetia bacterium]|nr:UPF0280 family protein [Spirochaetia bacterium]
MNRKRQYRSFSWKGANFRISSSAFDLITEEIIKQRKILSQYILEHEDFLTSLVPIAGIDKESPDIVKRMHRASLLTGIGPMASVAGVNAQLAAEAAVASGADEAVIENGGDIYLFTRKETVIALYAGTGVLSGRLAVKIKPEMTPLSICSSSGKMGHSLSLGNCDLATVTAVDGALADSGATLACNLVKKEKDIAPALERIMSIKGIQGVLIVKNEKIGIAGKFPELVRNIDKNTETKITKEKQGKEWF